MGEGRITPSRRTYTKVVLGAVVVVMLLDLLLLALDFVSARAFRHLAVAAILAVGGALLWEPVARIKPGQAALTLAWIAFPSSMLLALATMPFLAMSVFPPLEGILFRVEAQINETTKTILSTQAQVPR